MNMAQNAVGPCLFYQWIDEQLVVIILLWMDDFSKFGPDRLVPFIQLLVDEIKKKYVGCRVELSAIAKLVGLN